MDALRPDHIQKWSKTRSLRPHSEVDALRHDHLDHIQKWTHWDPVTETTFRGGLRGVRPYSISSVIVTVCWATLTAAYSTDVLCFNWSTVFPWLLTPPYINRITVFYVILQNKPVYWAHPCIAIKLDEPRTSAYLHENSFPLIALSTWPVRTSYLSSFCNNPLMANTTQTRITD